MTLLDDPRVSAGLTTHLADHDQRLSEGAAPLGWKAGYGTAAVMEAMSLSGPLFAALTETTLVPDGGTITLSGWTEPALEAELAVRLRTDVAPDATRDQVADAIDAVASAIEVVDFDLPRDQIEAVVAGGIFHRAVVLGPWDEGRAGANLDGVVVDVEGPTPSSDVDPTALIGDLVEIVQHIAQSLGATGRGLKAGEIVITGSAIVPVAVSPGDTVVVRHRGVGEVSVSFD